MKIILFIALTICAVKADFRDQVLRELINEYKSNDPHDPYDDLDTRFCGHTGLDCYRCPECHDHLQFGLCINDGDHKRKCLCKWGWTGPDAKKISDVGISEWSTNRIRAANCKRPCHYTHDVWNDQCLACNDDYCKQEYGPQASCHNNKCVPYFVCHYDHECKLNHGPLATCVNHKCTVLIDDPLFNIKKDYYTNIDPRFCGDTGLDCYKCSECHDHLQFGMCINDDDNTRKCLCKWGWTGPNAKRISDAGISEWSTNRVRASNCKTPCHYTHDVWDDKCIGGGGHTGCNELECKKQHGGYAKCINDLCIPDCDEYECMANYGTCKMGKCVPDCNDYTCKAQHGKCIKGKCVPDCDYDKCKAQYGTCKEGKCIPDCDDILCKAKYGTCKMGKCVPDCDDYACKAQYGTCKMGTCVPDCDPVECAKQYGKCEKGKCKPTCDDALCAAKNGKCFKGVCKIKCCRGASGPNHVYVAAEDTYYADNCDLSCPYLGTGVENPSCTKTPPMPSPCDPLCARTDGKCDRTTGKCICCKDFTGPNPIYDQTTSNIHADYCDTYCPTSKGKLCLNNNYIKRCTTKISIG